MNWTKMSSEQFPKNLKKSFLVNFFYNELRRENKARTYIHFHID